MRQKDTLLDITEVFTTDGTVYAINYGDEFYICNDGIQVMSKEDEKWKYNTLIAWANIAYVVPADRCDSACCQEAIDG